MTQPKDTASWLKRVSVLSIVRFNFVDMKKAARLAVYSEAIMREKNHQKMAKVRVEIPLKNKTLMSESCREEISIRERSILPNLKFA